jgi:hypothetical protein
VDMKANFLGMVAFCVALSIGIKIAAFVPNAAVYLTSPEKIEVSPLGTDGYAKFPAGVLISYLGETSDEGRGTGMRFLIYNGSAEPISCIGYEGVCVSPEIFISGEAAAEWICLNGSSMYTISPSQTAQLLVEPYEFARLPEKMEIVTIGYTFEHTDGRNTQSLAEPMTLPPAFRNAVSEAIKKRGDD